MKEKDAVVEKKMPDWTNDTVKTRLALCIAALHLNKIMTDAERIKMQDRLLKMEDV